MRPGGFELGKPIANYAVGLILRSENPGFNAGDRVYGMFPFEEYFVQSKPEAFRKLPHDSNIPLSAYLGTAGMPGQTAYVGWKEYANPKKGEVVFVSTGAGGVGSLVIQLAKRDGLKVIASAGSDDKVQFMKDIGADVAFNYKTTNTLEVLQKEGPIDIYWDNVGGQTFETALEAAAPRARFIVSIYPVTLIQNSALLVYQECGMISGYSSKPYAVSNLMNIVVKQIKVTGFIVSTLLPKYVDTFYKEIPALIASGELEFKEDSSQGMEAIVVLADE
ncbi:alcohol dehydrogenase [Phlebopus sp. FC_14]|nr:alcohol dehydrogenase [Phlebopus sp. FC_14]